MSRFVLDASVALCWCFEGQSTEYTEALAERLARGDEARVPGIWPLEVVNSLMAAERRKMLKPAQTDGFVEQMNRLRIHLAPAEIERSFASVLAVARQYRLSAYDAAYLELAIREGLPLATMDGQLRAAAGIAGVKLGPAEIDR